MDPFESVEANYNSTLNRGKMRLALYLAGCLLIFSEGVHSQSLSVNKVADKNSLQARFWSKDAVTESTLQLAYKMAIENLEMPEVTKARLEELVKGIFPHLFKVKANKSDKEAYRLAFQAKVSFELRRKGLLYAQCNVPADAFGYSFTAIGNKKESPYVNVSSFLLPVSSERPTEPGRPYILCRDPKTKASIEPNVEPGDLLVLKQNKKIVLRGKFK